MLKQTGLDNDDRPFVTSITVNEGSPFAVFEVTAREDLPLTFSLRSGSAVLGTDFLPALEYWDDLTSSWLPYTEGQLLNMPDDGDENRLETSRRYFRVAIQADRVAEVSETFTLTATNLIGSSAVGTGTIVDGGNGSCWLGDARQPATAVELSAADVVLDYDRIPPVVFSMRAGSDSGAVTDFTTANGNPHLHVVGYAGLGSKLALRGPGGELLTPDRHYRVREVPIADQPGRSVYVIEMLDADLERPGNQPYGDYFKGLDAGNRSNVADGTYAVLLDGEPIGDFEIDTQPITQAKRLRCLDKIYGGKTAFESQLYGYRTAKAKPSNGADEITGSMSRSETLRGLRGDDLINGVGNRFDGASLEFADEAIDQVDTLIGDKGRDAFQLADVAGSFYANAGRGDYALIKDFTKQDSIILQGQSVEYSLERVGSTLELSRGDELIAILKGRGINGFSLEDATRVSFL